MSSNLAKVWVLLGLDREAEVILLLGLRESTSRGEALAIARERHPAGPSNAFHLGKPYQLTGMEMHAWFCQCGFSAQEANAAVRDTAREMRRLLKDWDRREAERNGEEANCGNDQ